MTIDEAIRHCEKVAMNLKEKGFEANVKANNATEFGEKCYECASEHQQLAEWLKELKAYKENTCGDAISRQAVFEQIAEWIISGEYGFTNATDYLSKKIKALPSVTPQQRTGRWIWSPLEYNWHCSECQCADEEDKPLFRYCPMCGCKMEVEE